MWKRQLDGRVLTFRLAGINNQNFLMRDEETGSFWQQISGQAISGPLRGRQLELVHSDEISFSLWRAENPQGTLLRPVASDEKLYATKDWETKMQKSRTVIDTRASGIPPRELMFGVHLAGQSRAYLVATVLREKLILDRLGPSPILILLGPDNLSIRAFLATTKAGPADFYRNAEDSTLIDSLSGSRWNFQGCATAGPAVGECLPPISALKDYWFDWQLYHPRTTVFRR